MSGIEPLTGTNFSTWRDQVKLTLGVMDLDHVLRIDPPAALTVESTADQKRAYEQWEQSNRMSLMIIKNSISVVIRGAIPDSENAKEYSSSGKGSRGDNSTPNKVQKTDASTSSFQGSPKCKFCHKKGHTQKDCPKFKEWLAKKAEVENQLGRNVRLDRGGEYYGRRTDVGQAPGSFFDFCKNHGIINQYTMPGTPQQMVIKLQKARDEIPIIHVPILISMPLDTSNDHLISQDHPNNVEANKPNPEINVEPQETQQPLRRSQRNRQPINFDDYFTYLNEADFDLGKCNELESFENAITCDPSAYWREALKDVPNSMSKNNVWELVELPKGAKPVGCKWDPPFRQGLSPRKESLTRLPQRRFPGDLSTGKPIPNDMSPGKPPESSNNIDLLHESKRFLSRNFDIKDLGEASYVIGIELHRDQANGRLGLSQKAYIERILNRFNMQHCSPTIALIINGDVFGSHQCPKTEVEYEEMRRIPYASVVGSLAYAQICTRLDIAYICG
nr:putative zinc finger, CCHC-type [Tanacetum cinerariifolium]